jgi:hypothetical protein
MQLTRWRRDAEIAFRRCIDCNDDDSGWSSGSFPARNGFQGKDCVLPGGRRAFGLYVSSPDGGNEHPFLPDLKPSCNPSFSWDGRWIVFTSERCGSADIFRAHPDGSGLDRLTGGQAFNDQGVLSPDGRTLAVVSTRRGGTANIWLLDLSSHRVRSLTRNTAGNFRPGWLPDGQWIAFSSDRDMRHVRYIRDTGPAWELMQTTAVHIVHPDGSGLRQAHTSRWMCGKSPLVARRPKRALCRSGRRGAVRHFRTRVQIVSMDEDRGADRPFGWHEICLVTWLCLRR